MIILGIETSCDETSAAIIKNGTEIISYTITSSIEIQNKYGGVVPEVAARRQTEYIIPVLEETFTKAEMTKDDIDAIAVTVGPGLMGPLLIGLETAKTLSYVWQKPLIPINHLIGHIHSAWLDEESPTKPQFPLLALIASGGHTELLILKSHFDLTKIGSTQDDAVGEAFDKVARALNLGYPGGPILEKHADNGDITAFKFPRPMINSGDYNFSYSGLKTAVVQELQKHPELSNLSTRQSCNLQLINDICASFQSAALEILIEKTLRATAEYPVKSIVVTGGVAANQYLKDLFKTEVSKKLLNTTLHIPPLKLATDNATYIAGAGYFLYNKLALDPQKELDKILSLEPNPNLTSLEI